MRAFIAVELPERFRLETEGLARTLRRCVSGRFSPPENYHVTLAFLGDRDEREVRCAMDALEALAARAPGYGEGGGPDIGLHCSGLGSFGKRSDATLWLDLDGSPGLPGLASSMREELASRAVSFEDKPFRAHVTLARHAALGGAALPDLPFPQDCRAERVALFKSTLLPDGARYSPLLEVGL